MVEAVPAVVDTQGYLLHRQPTDVYLNKDARFTILCREVCAIRNSTHSASVWVGVEQDALVSGCVKVLDYEALLKKHLSSADGWTVQWIRLPRFWVCKIEVEGAWTKKPLNMTGLSDGIWVKRKCVLRKIGLDERLARMSHFNQCDVDPKQVLMSCKKRKI
jgi:hypothetical protein